MTTYSYPSADEILARLAAHDEIVYARDEGNGYTYITLKGKHHGDPERTSDPARTASVDPGELRTK